MHRLLPGTLPAIALVASLSAQSLQHGVAAGDVTDTAAILWARADTAGTITIELSTDRQLQTRVRSFQVTTTDVLAPVKRAVRGLTPNTRYYYRATDAGGASSVGSFVTADPVGTSDGFRFGVTGDSRGDNAPYQSLVNLPQRKPELIVLLGDTVYADIESPVLPGVSQATTLEQFRQKHAEIISETSGLNSLVDVRRSTHILATIDDHEVTNDFSGGADPASDPRFQDAGDFINETPLFDAGLQAFQDYHPIGEATYGDTGDARTADKRKLYRRRWYGSDAAIHVLDARSFRDEGLVPADVNDPADVIRFFTESFDPSRTMLGRVQVDELKADLQAAQDAGIRWKFVMVPEPIQNLGPAAASDRFEGYAAERTEILDFVHTNEIDNVVFVAADVHGTVVNDLQYQTVPGGPQIQTKAFEITTGAIAFDAPFGPTVVQLALALGFITPAEVAVYQGLSRDGKDFFVAGLINLQTMLFGYTPLGIEPSTGIDATLVQGGCIATHTWGWTEFDIAKETQALTITTYGVDPFDLQTEPEAISVIEVQPQ